MPKIRNARAAGNVFIASGVKLGPGEEADVPADSPVLSAKGVQVVDEDDGIRVVEEKQPTPKPAKKKATKKAAKKKAKKSG